MEKGLNPSVLFEVARDDSNEHCRPRGPYFAKQAEVAGESVDANRGQGAAQILVQHRLVFDNALAVALEIAVATDGC